MNEFSAPAQANPVGLSSPLPSSPKVFGILSIIFASIMLLINLPASCAGLFGSTVSNMGNVLSGEVEDGVAIAAVMDAVGSVYRVMGIQGVMMLAMSAVLLAISIGQLNYRRWAAKWSFVWGCLGLACLAIVIGLYVFVVGPAYERLFAAMASADPQAEKAAELLSGMGSMMGGWTSVAQVILLAPYPILMIVFFRKPDVVQAMNKEWSGCQRHRDPRATVREDRHERQTEGS